MEIPDQVGIMVLDNAILFPQALVPLYIFEPRYRLMLRRALEGQRIFAITQPDSRAEPRPVGAIGLIRVCVDRPDGTSELILQGMARVRFIEFPQREPYFVGQIELLATTRSDDPKVPHLAARVLTHVNRLESEGRIDAKGIVSFLNDLQDFDTLADIVSSSFIPSAADKQTILETLELPTRLQKIDRALSKFWDDGQPPLTFHLD